MANSPSKAQQRSIASVARTKSAPAAKKAKRKTRSAQEKSGQRSNSKQARLIAMLRAPGGATIAQIAKTFGWQPHTVRGIFSGALKKRLGLTITSTKAEGGERVYRIG